MSADDPGRQPTEEELRAALEAQLRDVRVEQMVLESTVSILNVAVMRAGLVPGSEDERDLQQVRVGIEAVRALMPLVELISGEQARPLRDALSQLQLAYVQAAEQEGGEGEPGGGGEPRGGPSGGPGGPGGPAGGPGQQPPARPAGPGSGQRSGRLWVPGQ